jgi:hypothetical protein
MALERWLPVVGNESEYEVSSLGRVRSLSRMRRGKAGSLTPMRGRVLRTGTSGAGYLRVLIQRHSVYVHRLVATAFIPNPLSRPEVNHQDGVKTNNASSNLAWVTHRENGQHASRAGLLAVGDNHGRCARRRREALQCR